jgi:5-methylcytosine-specific restriction enzyme subunit McrC
MELIKTQKHTDLIKIQEHAKFCFLPEFEPKNITNESNGKVFGGLYFDFKKGQKYFAASYFIGACWLEEKQLALQIEPKIKDLDYLCMFLKCFEHPKVSQHLSEIYHINFNQAKIALESSDFEITPLLIVHFLQVVKSIVKKGLKKNYYPVEENLNAKVKGKINISHTLKHNIFKGQNHKTVCNYQTFGLDCLENRLLKKALKFVQSYLAKSHIKTEANLKHTLSYCLAPFELVSDDVDIRTLKTFKNNAFFKEYSQGLKLAKMILKRFSYNLKNTQNTQQTPPFYIDMSLLFEQFVYTLLLKNNEVEYQVKGNYGKVDFLVNDMIVDTKYKPKYKKNKGYKHQIEDIRQLSGYARDEKIRTCLKIDNTTIAKCLIIYPNKDKTDNDLSNLWNDSEEIQGFVNFKKIGVKLPVHSPR